MWKRVRQVLFGAGVGAALTSLFVEVIILWEVAKSQRLRGDDSLFIFMLSGAVAGFLVGMWDSFRRPTPTATSNRRRALWWLVGVPTVAALMLAGFCASSPACRYAVIGLFNGEPRYDGLCRSFWAEELAAPEANRRSEAAYAFGFLGPLNPPTISKVCVILQNPNEGRKCRYNALAALENAPIGDSEAIAALTAVINEPDSPVLKDACGLLFKKIATGRLETLSRFLSHPNSLVRRDAADALGAMGRAALPTVPTVLVLSEKHSDMMRGYRSVGEAAPEEFVSHVRDYLRLSRPSWAEQFLVGLRTLESVGRPFVPLLIELLSDSDEAVRLKAIQWLSSLNERGDEKAEAALPALKKLDGDPSEPVRRAAKLAVQEIAVSSAMRSVERMRLLNEMIEARERGVAVAPAPPAAIVTALKPSQVESVTAITGRLTSENRYEVADAINALGARGPDAAEAVPALRAMAWRNFWDGRTDRDLLDALNRIEPGTGTWVKWQGYLLISTPVGCVIAIVFLVLRWLGLVCIRAFRPVPRRYTAVPSAGSGPNRFDDSSNTPPEPHDA